jgi:hypothetical protein
VIISFLLSYLYKVKLIIELKSPIFWDIMPCSQLRISRRFGATCRLHQSEQLLLAVFMMLVSCLAYSSTPKMEAICSSKRRLTLNGLHGVVSHMIGLFVTIGVRTSNPTSLLNYFIIYWSGSVKWGLPFRLFILNPRLLAYHCQARTLAEWTCLHIIL